jgi:hypothetical protein
VRVRYTATATHELSNGIEYLAEHAPSMVGRSLTPSSVHSKRRVCPLLAEYYWVPLAETVDNHATF